MKKTRPLAKAILLSLFLTVFIMNTSAQKVTLSFQNETFEKVLNSIKQQTGLSLVFSEQLVNLNRKVSISVNSIQVEDALKQLLTGTNLSYEIKNNKLYLVENKNIEPKKADGQSKKINGLVTDEKGDPIIGANVIIEGSTIGTITDLKGKFSLDVPNIGSKVVVSYIGYNKESLKFNGQSEMKIKLLPDLKILEEIVVVGYGTQKKLNLSGAIDVIGSKQIESIPAANITQVLQGSVPGLIIQNGGGKPGTALAVKIRAAGTLGEDTNPLVVIDGVTTDMNSFNVLNPNDVESISVLKDAASSAIYGSRAANGVIIVTTKKGGKNKSPQFIYSTNYSVEQPTKTFDMLNSWEYAELRNEQLTNSNKQPQFTSAMIQAMKDGSNPDKYANTNWWNAGVKSNSNMQNHNLSMNGGNEMNQYMISFGYVNQSGLISLTDYERYNVRVNLNTKITNKLKAGVNVSFFNELKEEPFAYGAIFDALLNQGPQIPVKTSDGNWGHSNNEVNNPISWMTDGGYIKESNSNIVLSGNLEYEIIKDLKFRGHVSSNFWSPSLKILQETIYYVNDDKSTKTFNENSQIQKQINQYNTLGFDATLNYVKSFNEKHNINLLAGYNEERYNNTWVGGSRNFVSDGLSEIDAATGAGGFQNVYGSSDNWRMRSVFGRVNYDFKQRYLLELNMRHDGSSRLSKGNYFRSFPSGSAAWRISDENFMKPLRDKIDNLKLRGSYGQVGNQTIPLYSAHALYSSIPNTYMFNHGLVSGSYASSIGRTDLSWEVTTITDFGIDIAALNNRLSATFDWYKKNTDGILLRIPVSNVVGIESPIENAGKVKAWGWELLMGWQDKINEFSYGITLNVSDQLNEVVDLKGTGPFRYGSTIMQEGSPMHSLYGYESLGFFTSAEDIANSPKIAGYANQIRIGDLKYKDISGPDGIPDGKITSDDKTIIGWSSPRYLFGLDLNAAWKGIDLRAFFQGVGKRDEFTHGTIMYVNGGSSHIYNERWHPEKSLEENLSNAKYPRLNDGEGNNYEISTFWKHNASYVRLKNLQFGYTLPKTFTNKVNIEKLRVYFSGTNLFTLTKFPYIDPEGSSGGGYYPQLKSYSIGLTLTVGNNK